jgi:hypothetical protein
VIDPVQSEKPDENQVDSHCEAHDPGRNQQEHSRGQGSDWQKRLGSIEVHPGLITDSDASPPAGAGEPCAGAGHLGGVRLIDRAFLLRRA